jgi:hypothetical protein
MTGKRNFVLRIYFTTALLFFSFTDANAYADDFEKSIKFFTELNGCFDIFQHYLKDKDSANKFIGVRKELIILRAEVNLKKAVFSDLVDRLESCTVIIEDLDYVFRRFDNNALNSEFGIFTKLCPKLREEQEQEKNNKKSNRHIRKISELSRWPDLFFDSGNLGSLIFGLDKYHADMLRYKDKKEEIQTACLKESEEYIRKLRQVIDLMQKFNENSFQMIIMLK